MALQHLKIQVVEGVDKSYVFTAWINPSSYQYSYGIKAGANSASKGSAPNSKIEAYAPDSISLKLLLDATGLIAPPLPKQGIPKDGVVSLINGFLINIARPYAPKNAKNKRQQCQPKLNLSWAQLQFSCILTSLSIDYKLFKPDGTPIRAELTCSFSEFRESPVPKKQAVAVDETPLAPQQVMVMEGDTLPALCDEFYGDAVVSVVEVAAGHPVLAAFRKTGSLATGTPPAVMSAGAAEEKGAIAEFFGVCG